MRMIFLMVAGLLLAPTAGAADFVDDLARVDEALRDNPSHVMMQSIEACKKQRKNASKLYEMGMETRARRALQFCFDALAIPASAPVVRMEKPSVDELTDKANAEYKAAMALAADPAGGLEVYRGCAACHEPEGWGKQNGTVPQIAGQHRSVIIRQLADFRSGHRESVVMAPYSSVEAIGGTQAVADVAAYIASLEISVDNGKGPGDALALGEQLYGENCADCHGPNASGSDDGVIPRLQAQHFRYLKRQFEWIQSGNRHNADPEMAIQIEHLEMPQYLAILDYVSRLQPEAELQAPEGWKNPDFQSP